MLTALQKKTAQAIVQIFETGSLTAKSYGTVTMVKGDKGRLTYGLHQTTVQSGNLYLLMKAYVEAAGEFATTLKPWLPYFASKHVKCDTDKNLHAILRQCGDDPIMRKTQDEFFDRIYWNRAADIARDMGFTQPLSFAVVYDSIVHGAWHRLSKAVSTKLNMARVGNLVNEKKWITAYVLHRKVWLSGQYELLTKTVYRMQAFDKLIANNAWQLALPLRVRGFDITQETLGEESPPRASAAEDDDEPRLMLFMAPPLRGMDVAVLKNNLLRLGKLKAANMGDANVFDAATSAAVKAFQRSHGLKVDGIVGPLTMDRIKVAKP
mgnify:CR=1 FL=1